MTTQEQISNEISIVSKAINTRVLNDTSVTYAYWRNENGFKESNNGYCFVKYGKNVRRTDLEIQWRSWYKSL